MSKRASSVLAAAAIASAALIGALFVVREVAGEPDSPISRLGGAGPYRGSEPPAGIRIPTFALRDVVSGRLVQTGDLEGRVLLVTFLDTDCREQCPLIAGQIGRRARASG